jgi:hypothetical protein
MIEEKRNQINLELRKVLYLVDIIDGNSHEYPDYEEELTEEEFLDQQLMLAIEIRDRLQRIFKS